MPNKKAHVKNEKQYEALKDKGMSKERAAKIANSPGASSRGGKKSGSGGSSKQGGTTAQKKAAGPQVLARSRPTERPRRVRGLSLAYARRCEVGERGFEPLKAEPTGLQPVPFGHSGTPPQRAAL